VHSQQALVLHLLWHLPLQPQTLEEEDRTSILVVR
jgi:hypothetical protein